MLPKCSAMTKAVWVENLPSLAGLAFCTTVLADGCFFYFGENKQGQINRRALAAQLCTQREGCVQHNVGGLCSFWPCVSWWNRTRKYLTCLFFSTAKQRVQIHEQRVVSQANLLITLSHKSMTFRQTTVKVVVSYLCWWFLHITKSSFYSFKRRTSQRNDPKSLFFYHERIAGTEGLGSAAMIYYWHLCFPCCDVSQCPLWKRIHHRFPPVSLLDVSVCFRPEKCGCTSYQATLKKTVVLVQILKKDTTTEVAVFCCPVL